MVAVLSIDKAVDRPSDNIIIGQTLNTWVKLSWDEFIQVAEDPY